MYIVKGPQSRRVVVRLLLVRLFVLELGKVSKSKGDDAKPAFA